MFTNTGWGDVMSSGNSASELSETCVQILLKALELEWGDRHEIRRQTWHTVQVSWIFIVGLLGAQLVDTEYHLSRLHSSILTWGCFGLLLVSVFGFAVSWHQRKCERKSLMMIKAIERKLPVDKNGQDLFCFLDFETKGYLRNGHSFFSVTSFVTCYHAIVLCIVLYFIARLK